MDENKPKSTPRDFFLNLLSTVALYFSATSFGILIFQYINILVPDVLDKVGYGGDPYTAMRFPVASLFILFPVYVWSAWFLEKEFKKFPERREVSIRRWLVYLTLFVAALAIIGDLVALVYTFLNGEVSARFALKVLTILLIAGSVFYYYLSSLRKMENKFLKIFVYGVIAVVSVSVIASFVVAGSPSAQKDRRLDERRVSDLANIQNEVVNFWVSKGALPANLSDLSDDVRGVIVPTDPETEETGASYTYRILSDLSFELCATFSSDSVGRLVETPYYPYIGGNWDHRIGEVCFERTIDPDFYKNIHKKYRFGGNIIGKIT